MKPLKLRRLLAGLGYGTRREVEGLVIDGRVTDAAGERLYADDVVDHAEVRLDGAPLDHAHGLLVMLHKPVGYTCALKDPGRLVYDLLPPRWKARDPVMSTVGRLDRDTSGLLLLTDDGQLLHRIISPKSHLPKVYEATLAEDLRGDEGAAFASGTLMLEGESKPLLPAGFEALGPRRARLVLHEGRYHQVRRMFAAIGHHVAALHRPQVGGLDLGELPVGEWVVLDEAARARLFAAG